MFKLLLLAIVANVYSVNSASDPELKLVSVVFRHGARTTYSFYPKDPHKDTSFYPYGSGQLTNTGKMGEYNLGLYLKSLYGDFLGEDWTEDKVYVRSTDVTRTKMSAQLVLAGLFPPSDILTWNNQLLWIPVPVAYKPDSEEDLFHPGSNCPYKLKVLADLPNIEEVQQIYIKPFEEMFSYIQNNSGKDMEVPSDAQDLFFILKCEQEWNLTLEAWTDSIFPDKLEEAAAHVYGYHNYDHKVMQINSGYHIRKILDDAKSKIDGKLSPAERKIFLYSGHESTMGYMLNALQVDVSMRIPPYGSALAYELWQSDDEAYIKLQYRNSTESTAPQDLTLPGCDLLCPYDKFVKLLADVIPTESIQDACKA